jgi:hypothetical protein
MRLTGVPLILVAVLATAVTGAATVLLWSRFGRWRSCSRTAGILLTETLYDRHGRAGREPRRHVLPVLGGARGPYRHDARSPRRGGRPAGRAGARHRGGDGAVAARRRGAGGWPARRACRSAGRIPAAAVGGLSDRGVACGQAGEAGRRVRGAPGAGGRVVAVPTAGTTAAALATLPADLAADVRVNARGWAVAATPRQAALGARLARAGSPYGALVVVGATAGCAGRPAGDVPRGRPARAARTGAADHVD